MNQESEKPSGVFLKDPEDIFKQGPKLIHEPLIPSHKLKYFLAFLSGATVTIGTLVAWVELGRPTNFSNFEDIADDPAKVIRDAGEPIREYIHGPEEPIGTEEQIEYGKLLEEGKGDRLQIPVEVLEIVDPFNGEPIPVKVRDKPKVWENPTDHDAGKVIGTLEAGYIITDGIFAVGNNPTDAEKDGVWIAFLFEDSTGEEVTGFTFIGNTRPVIEGVPITPVSAENYTFD